MIFRMIVFHCLSQRLCIWPVLELRPCLVNTMTTWQHRTICKCLYTPSPSIVYIHYSCSSIIENLVPKYLRHRIHPDDIAKKHSEYSELSADDCNEAFMGFVQQWQLYGSTVFEVIQAYTTTLPKNLWLAVNEVGIHILKRRDKEPLVTYEYKSIVNYR